MTWCLRTVQKERTIRKRLRLLMTPSGRNFTKNSWRSTSSNIHYSIKMNSEKQNPKRDIQLRPDWSLGKLVTSSVVGGCFVCVSDF